MEIKNLSSLYGKNIIVFVRYGFKKKIEELQSYKGKLINSDQFGLIIEREVLDECRIIEINFVPWHNIDALRYRIE
jgi:hypothetical protein